MSNVPELRFSEFASTGSAQVLGEWKKKKLIDTAVNGFSNGVFNDPKKVGSGYKLINVKDMYEGDGIDVEKLLLLELSDKEFQNNKVVFGDTFFTRSSLVKEGIAWSNVMLEHHDDISYDGHLIKMSLDKEKINPYFFSNLLKTATFRKQAVSRGKTGTMTTIGQEDMASIIVAVPSIEEQQKIATFLSAVDKKLGHLRRKHELLESYKRGIMQKIFSQELRFKQDNGADFPDWEEKRLETCLVEFKEKTKVENEFEVFTSSKNGLLLQKDYYGENRITERSNKGFHIVPEGFITYRSRSDNRKFYFNINDLGYSGIISTYYPVFNMINGTNRFFIELSRHYIHLFGKHSVGTSQSVLSFKELGRIKVVMPVEEEQQKITNFLLSLDKKIEAVQKQIDQTEIFKKGLLQKMFV